MMYRHLSIIACIVLLLPACGSPEPPASGSPEPSAAAAPAVDPDYAAEIAALDAEREEVLRDPDGWLTLAGLFWLEEGPNTFGSDPDADLVFPDPAPPRAGVFHRDGEEVTLEVEPGVELLHDGEPAADGLRLVADVDGEETVLALGSLRFYAIRRGDRVGVRLRDHASPVLAAFTGIDRFPVDPAWRLTARFEEYDPPRHIDVPNILGDVSEVPCLGRLVFEVDGQQLALEPMGYPDDELFLVFGDQTNGEETYGGGRFLSTGPVAEDDTVTLDFNKAYNPPCVYTPYATCPLPPPQNKLAVRVEAGETMYGEAH